MNILHARAIWLGDALCLGGGKTSGHNRDKARLYVYTPTTDAWRELDTPVYYLTLITYHSQLVLVGGREFVGDAKGPVTNKLWTLIENNQWKECLPPMTAKRCDASAVDSGDNILVAGGVNDKGRNIDIVEVYNGHHWARAQRLPQPCYQMKSAILNGHWYLMGGLGQETEVYHASLDSIVESCQSRDKSLPSVWNRLPNVPYEHSSTAVFGNKLITLGGGGFLKTSSSIHAYFPHSQSWVHVGDMPVKLASTCATIFPTGELIIMGGWSVESTLESCVYKASLNGN